MILLARAAALGGTFIGASCVVFLHVARTDLEPASHRLSEYANGPFGWVMTAAFLSLGVASIGMGLVLGPTGRRDAVGISIRMAAFAAALGLALSAAYETAGAPTQELIHSRASAVAVIGLLIVAVAHSILRTRAWRSSSSPSLDATIALALVTLAVISPALHETHWTGLGQRLLWLALLIWMTLAVRDEPATSAAS